jgi:hypothetical protein
MSVEMSINRFSLAVCLTALMLITSCAMPYVYNGVSYRSTTEALGAQQSLHRDILTAIPHESAPRFESLAFVIPTKDLMRQHGIPKERGFFDPQRLSGEQREYLVEARTRGQREMADFVEARNLFRTVSVHESDDPQATATALRRDNDAVMYILYSDQETAAWLLWRRQASTPVPVNVDPSVSAGLPRVMAWLKKIEQSMN